MPQNKQDGSSVYMLKTGHAGSKRLELQHNLIAQSSYDRLKKAGLKQGSVVWDLGCGNGMMTAYLAKEVGPDGHVYAIDISETQLELAKEHVCEQGFKNVTFIKADVSTEIDFPKESIDIIFCRFLLMHVKNPDFVIHTMKNVLKPGGSVVNQESTMSAQRGLFRKDLDAAIDAIITLGRYNGVDYDIRFRLKNLYNQAGFVHVEEDLSVIDLSGKDIKTSFLMGLAEWKDKVIETNIATPEQVLMWQNVLQSIADDESFPCQFHHAVVRKQ
jgi:2-polyprenyl-3-methyl-5-hydroxy-6-metoxy-1,4-benzoquinol methylase